MTTKIFVISEKYWPQGGEAEYTTHLMLSLLSVRNNDLITVLTTPETILTVVTVNSIGMNKTISDILSLSTNLQIARSFIVNEVLTLFGTNIAQVSHAENIEDNLFLNISYVRNISLRFNMFGIVGLFRSNGTAITPIYQL